MTNSALLIGDVTLSDSPEHMTLVQVTDTHLTGDSDGTLLGMNTERSARQVIDAALASQQPDCVLVTGDIAADGQAAAYEQLNGFFNHRVPTLWLPGNHDDVRAQKDAYRDHLKRRIVGRHWDVLMLETQVVGKVGGYFSSAELDALQRAVADAAAGDKSLLIATHHPLRALQSTWLDEQAVSNASAALTIMQALSDRVVVVSGHVHQESDAVVQGVRMLTTPSTCIQFAPQSHDFALDDKQPGYRRIVLQPNGQIETQVIRICDEENRPLSGSSGYH
ncbi:metallophosphoesterase [Luminiphilus sp.]|jgi:Icc protein|nr:metallophosphoesterase [Luminiphilus sp.]MDB3918484.1 metallophosphoesterase [Luminiphilus sp.]MDC0974008.1 metallophosphoesterase [Luminiphilus sp.]